jgi:DNA-binding transcriptional MerR regulator
MPEMKDLSIKKLYYSISEVSKITEVEQYVLRYWETEFESLKPQKNRAGNRIYTNKDIQLIMQIKSLLRDKKYTIEGAKKILETVEPEIEVLKPIEFSTPESFGEKVTVIEKVEEPAVPEPVIEEILPELPFENMEILSESAESQEKHETEVKDNIIPLVKKKEFKNEDLIEIKNILQELLNKL